MKIRYLFALALIASCSRNVDDRQKLFYPELKFGAPRSEVVEEVRKGQQLEMRGQDLHDPRSGRDLVLGVDRDSNVNSLTYVIPHRGRADGSVRSRFAQESNRALEIVGTPDEWIKRDTIAGERMVWYYPEDSVVLSLEQRRSGTIALELTKSGQRYRDVQYEMRNFLVAPQ